jgi:heme/copper-type cytochrome/quinol oxidase subunit 4
MTSEEKSDRRRTLIVTGIIILIVWILAGSIWWLYMQHRLETGGHIGF